MTDASKPSSITLRIDGRRTDTDTSLSGWPAEVFAIDGVVRGAEGALTLSDLPPDAVLELELASGERLLVAAEDAGRYLAGGPGRGAEEGGALSVGPALRFAGVRPPSGLARDGLGAWIIKSLRVFRQGPAGMTAYIAAGSFQDRALDDHNGLYRCAVDHFELTQVEALPLTTEPTLLFIHGTASSTRGSFGELWTAQPGQAGPLSGKLAEAYGARLYACEHRSLTESPIENALALVKTLPKGARLHVVSHSRGGMVGELLARAGRVGSEPFTEAEIARFLDHAIRSARPGFEKQVAMLRELNRELATRAIRVERFVRVACPARGTTLASGRLDRWASVMLNLVGHGVNAVGELVPVLAPAAPIYAALKNFLLAVVKERCDARVLPGLEAMMPDSPLVALLNGPDVKLDAKLHVVAGDFRGKGLLPWLGDCVSEIFYGGATDLVVNTPSMSGGAERAQGIFLKPVQGPQVTHFTYFERNESALALLGALRGSDADYAALPGPSREFIARGGKEIKPRPDAPIVFLLPGIMGSHIVRDDNRIWFDPVDMCAGWMDRLRWDAPDVVSDGWLDMSYERLARHLAESHELRPFAYDWRLSIVAAAQRFGTELDTALLEAEKRGKPLRIVAHSMGGLVARLALASRWERFKKNPGNRLLQLGTPNRGSHAIAAVLMGRDDFVQTIERWFDWKHDMKEFLDIVRDFPGVLELLPWPGADGCAEDGVDYHDAPHWQAWFDQDADPRRDKTWLPPQAGPLAKARAAIAAIAAAPLDPERTLYVAGRAPTPCAVRLTEGRVEIAWSDEGDGRVLWKTGIPSGVPVWYAAAAHGDLADHEPAFDAYRELLETGRSASVALTRVPTASRGSTVPVFRPRGLEAHALYPSAAEVLAAALGGARPEARTSAPVESPAEIVVYHAGVGSAAAPVLIGAYAHDSLRGTARFLDHHLGGELTRSHKLGLYPGELREAKVYLHPERNGKPGGAIVVGLGPIGELKPGELTRTLTAGLIEYARLQGQLCRTASADFSPPVTEPGFAATLGTLGIYRPERLEASALLVGTGFTGLTVEVGVRCLAEALRDANARLADSGSPLRIERLALYEEAEERASAAVEVLREAMRDPRLAAVRFDGRLRCGNGGYRGRCVAADGQPGAYRIIINTEHSGENRGGLRFTVISDRARNEVVAEPDQRQAIDGLIAAATGVDRSRPDTSPRLACALFQLMLPNGMKAAVAELRTLMLSLDAQAAAYPWELMRDNAGDDRPPLAARVELVRQFASQRGRQRPPTETAKRAFVVGDTQSDMPELSGAQREAKCVAATLRGHGIEVDDVYKADARQVLEGLLCGNYRYVHLAGHGVVKDKATGHTGMVLGAGSFLTAAQVAKLPYVPEFVFLNCCYLGDMRLEAETPQQSHWGELAANLAAQFIEIGCKAVVAAGWAVDDDAGETFAQVFYDGMLAGKRFGRALLDARSATYAQHRFGNTWGAFQAYGDERYRFSGTTDAAGEAEDMPLPSQLVADLDKLAARLHGAGKNEKTGYYRKRLEALETAARSPECRTAEVCEKLGNAWAGLGENERAIGHYRAALAAEPANASLRMVECLANLEIRYGAGLPGVEGDAYMDTGRARLQLLEGLGKSVERLSLRGSYWKRMAQRAHSRGDAAAIDGHLRHMVDAYSEAAEHGYRQGGEWDYYPLFNALDGAFLLAARGASATPSAAAASNPSRARTRSRRKPVQTSATALSVVAFEALHALTLRQLLDAGSANASRRFADDRDVFHALAPIEARRIEALWAALNDPEHRGASTDFSTDIANIARTIRDTLNCLGNARQRDSVVRQPQFLLDLLPDDERTQAIRKALREMIAALKN